MKIRNKFIALIALVFILSSCQKDFLETAPTDKLSSNVMFESTQGAMLALNGMYRSMYVFTGNHDGFGHMAVNLNMDLMGEDMVLHSAGYGWFRRNYNFEDHRNADAASTGERWRFYYELVNNANIIIQYVDDAAGLPSEKNNIKAQAFAMRGFAYYQLAQLYAPAITQNPNAPGLPLYLEPTQEGVERSPLSAVYAQIQEDYTTAINLFDGSLAQAHKSHVSLPVVHGLMARMGLASGDYPLALTHANQAIGLFEGNLFTSDQYVASNFNNATATEWMWGSVINGEHATIFASFMSHMDARILSYAQLGLQKKVSLALYDQISDTDVRKALFIAPGEGEGAVVDLNQMKFLVQTPGSWVADYLYMRVAEMYLIKAEAEARTSGNAAQTLYDLVSQRDASYTLSANTGEALIEEILLHRRIELWGEGFRFPDIKRLGLPLVRPSGDGNHDASLAVVMNLDANSNMFVWKIPTREIDANDGITQDDQNP